jgi:hypothetical protein
MTKGLLPKLFCFRHSCSQMSGYALNLLIFNFLRLQSQGKEIHITVFFNILERKFPMNDSINFHD